MDLLGLTERNRPVRPPTIDSFFSFLRSLSSLVFLGGVVGVDVVSVGMAAAAASVDSAAGVSSTLATSSALPPSAASIAGVGVGSAVVDARGSVPSETGAAESTTMSAGVSSVVGLPSGSMTCGTGAGVSSWLDDGRSRITKGNERVSQLDHQRSMSLTSLSAGSTAVSAAAVEGATTSSVLFETVVVESWTGLVDVTAASEDMMMRMVDRLMSVCEWCACIRVQFDVVRVGMKSRNEISFQPCSLARPSRAKGGLCHTRKHWSARVAMQSDGVYVLTECDQ